MDFSAIASEWSGDFSLNLLNHVYNGYRAFSETNTLPNSIDERSITQKLYPYIDDQLSGFEPYFFMHGPYENETKRPPPAQQPQYDYGFILRANDSFIWPLEAKKLKNAKDIAGYLSDINNEFLVCRYSPFSKEASMIGYLCSGDIGATLTNLEAKLGVALEPILHSTIPNHRKSQHSRKVPVGKKYPVEFTCHHLILPIKDILI